MALEKVGLGAVLTFDSSTAVAGMGRVRNAMGQFVAQEKAATAATNSMAASLQKLMSSAGNLGSALGNAANQFGQSMRTAGLMALPATAAFGLMGKDAADFEHAMAGVRAIMFDTTDEAFKPLVNEAKRLGMTTIMSAEQAASGMAELARGGLNAKEIMSSVGSVMSMASAEEMELARASEIVINTMQSMGLKAENTAGIANVLALASARTATDIDGLGHAVAQSSSQAFAMGIPLNELVAVLGVLGDSGLRGTLAGTSFTNMLVKLGDPTKQAIKYTKQLGAATYEYENGSVDVIRTLSSYAEGLKNVHSKTEKAAIISEIFGLRGQKAVNAFSQALESGKIVDLVSQLGNEMGKTDGAAQKMAGLRLDSLTSRLTMLKNTIAGFSIEAMNAFMGPWSDGVDAARLGLVGIVEVMAMLNDGTFNSEKAVEKYGATTVSVAQGIADGFRAVSETITEVRNTVVGFFTEVTGQQSPEMIRQFAKIATVAFTIAAFAAPFMIALGGMAYFLTAVIIPLFTSLGPIFAAIGGAGLTAFIGPVLAAIMVLGTAFYLLKDTIMGTFAQVWESAKSGMEFMFEGFQYLVTDVVGLFQGLWNTMRDGFKFIGPLLMAFLRPLAQAIGGVFNLLGHLFGVMAFAFGKLLTMVKVVLRFVLGAFLNSIQWIVQKIIQLADAVGVSSTSLTDLRAFAAQPEFKLIDEGNMGAEAGNAITAQAATDEMAAQKRDGAEPPAVNVDVALEDKRCIEVQNSVALDGREISRNQGKHKQEIHERAGFKAQPWQRRVGLEQGAVPNGGTG
jgi:TP901 family phage tail tape measure protein